MRKQGPVGTAISIIGGLVMLGIFVAALRMFNGDVIAVFMFLWDKAVEFVLRVADAVSKMPLFRNLFS